jgi:hypothetical protein
MVDLHARLADGDGLAAALRGAANEVRDVSPRHAAVAAATICCGAG